MPFLPCSRMDLYLRKARSNSDMVGLDSGSHQNMAGGTPSVGRLHSKSVTGADMAPFTTAVRSGSSPKNDIFSEVMEWSVPPPMPSSSSFRRQAWSRPGTPLTILLIMCGLTPRSLILLDLASLTAQPLANRQTRRCLFHDKYLREMQSFESGLAARQANSSVGYGQMPSPCTILESAPASPDISRHRSRPHPPVATQL